MNIKEHIEAGHYERDKLGRALVPCDNGDTATIAATDAPGEWVLLGWQTRPQNGCGHGSWHRDGRAGFTSPSNDRADLLPPPPRKVEVKAWKLIVNGKKVGLTDDPELARHWRNGCVSDDELIELSGIHEEPWIK